MKQKKMSAIATLTICKILGGIGLTAAAWSIAKAAYNSGTLSKELYKGIQAACNMAKAVDRTAAISRLINQAKSDDLPNLNTEEQAKEQAKNDDLPNLNVEELTKADNQAEIDDYMSQFEGYTRGQDVIDGHLSGEKTDGMLGRSDRVYNPSLDQALNQAGTKEETLDQAGTKEETLDQADAKEETNTSGNNPAIVTPKEPNSDNQEQQVTTTINTEDASTDWRQWYLDRRNEEWDREDARKKEQQERDDNAYTRMIADMRRAGINPNLVNGTPNYGTSVASTSVSDTGASNSLTESGQALEKAIEEAKLAMEKYSIDSGTSQKIIGNIISALATFMTFGK